MKKRTIIIAVAVILIVIVAIWYFFLKEKNANGQYSTVKVERGTIEERVTATGRIEALVTVSVGSQVSGIINELLADYNSIVKKDQVVALLEPSIFTAQKKQAEANLASAKANLEKAEVALEDAKRNLKRGEELFGDKLISESDRDALKTTYESAVAQLSVSKAQTRQTEAALTLAEVNLTHTVIMSPIDGIVVSRNVDVGQTVAASLQAPTLFTIANDLTKMQVHSDIAESDVGRVLEGQDVTFRVDAFPIDQFKGRVMQVRNEGKIVQNVVTYDAVIDVDNKDLKLKPGMTAYVSILVQKRDNALKIPNSALRFKPSSTSNNDTEASPSKAHSSYGEAGGKMPKGSSGSAHASGKPIVWLLKGEKLVPAEVTIGITDGKFSEVVEGELSSGDAVVTEELYSEKKEAQGMPGFGRH